MAQDVVKKTMARTKFSCGPKRPLLYSRCTSGAKIERQGSIGMGPMPCLPRETSLTPRSRSSPRHALALTGLFCGLPVAGPAMASATQAQQPITIEPAAPPRGPAVPLRNFPRETRNGTAMPTRGRVYGFRSTMASEEAPSSATHQPPKLRPGTHVPLPKEDPADPGPRSRPDDRLLPEDPRPKAVSIRFGGSHRMRTRHPCQKAFHLAANLPPGRGFLRQPDCGFARRFNQQPDRLRNHHACACRSNIDELKVKVQ